MVSDASSLLTVLDEAAAAVAQALAKLDDWGLAGTRPWQYRSDLVADEAALAVLDRAGLGVLSEESGHSWSDRPITVVLDPVDGSTNASRGVPWYATSLCAVDADGPLAALVVNLAIGTRFAAVRGGGALRDGEPIHASSCEAVGDAIIGVSGLPPRHLGWSQFRSFGAAALDLCAVASGLLDGFIDCSPSAHAPWDYLGGLLVCEESGAIVGDALDRDLVVLEHTARRTPLAAATPTLFGELFELRQSFT